MSSRLLVRIDGDGALHWRADDGAHGTGAPPAARVEAADQVVALVPGADVLLTEVELPATSAARQARVLPFALEDQVLDPVEELHFALAPTVVGGRSIAAAVARNTLDGWLANLHEAGLRPDALLPDTLAVPQAGDAASLLLEHGQALVRLDACSGFACPAGQVPVWLAARLPSRLVVHRVDAAEPLPSLPPGVAVETAAPAPALDTLAGGLDDAPPFNLLQGDYAPRHRRAPQRRLWRVAAVLAALALLLALAAQVAGVLRLRAANARVDDAIAAAYAKAFPGQPMAADPVARTRSELERLGGDGSDAGLLPLLARIAPVLRQHGKQYTTLGIDYRNATLELAVRAPDLAGIDQLREQLASLRGLTVELTAATPGDNGVDGRLRIRGGGA
ncbi:MAG TPA: type II secretion system protein GspL [Rhodanobacteraceae bacterium]|nr:type II secretion system protein GspL [Rhodanobacteraceae bacterium]